MVYANDPWKDKFAEPTTEQLRSALPGDATRAFDRVRKYLLQLDGIDESLAWYGHCWCWTIEYRMSARDEKPLAVLIPSPEDLQFGMPVEQAFVDELPFRRLKRGVRDGLDLAREPFDTRWAVWSMHAGQLVEDLQDLVKCKVAYANEK